MPIPRTPEALEALEQQIVLSHGDLMAACRALQCNVLDVNQWASSDPEVHQRIHNARLVGWSSLESEAIRRATGYEEEVWYQGEMVGTTTKYSDGLLQTLLKARVSGHKEDSQATRAMVQVNIMPRALTYEEWQAQRQIELQSDDSQGRVDAMHSHMTEDAEYTEVSDEAKAAYEIMRPHGNGLPDWL